MRNASVIAISGFVLGACTVFGPKSDVYNADQIAIVRRQAAFDMACPEEKVQILEMAKSDSGRVERLGAVGCAKKFAFVRVSDYDGTRWVLDGARRKR